MKDREDKRPESEGYRFMNETIKNGLSTEDGLPGLFLELRQPVCFLAFVLRLRLRLSFQRQRKGWG